MVYSMEVFLRLEQREDALMSTNEPTTSPATATNQPFTLLVPLDGSPLSEQAIPMAAQLCRSLAGRLILVRVLPYPVLPLAADGGYVPADVYQQLEEDERHMAQDELQPLTQSLQSQGLSSEMRIEVGQPASALLDMAERLPADLIVMTTHGRTGLARFALGSVADRVVRGGHVPVLLLRSFAATPDTPTLAQALVPLDGTPFAERALELALRLAGPVLREVTLLRVVDDQASKPVMDDAQQYLDMARSRLVERLAHGACTVHTAVRSGNVADVILAAAGQPSDLVLMATHGSAGIGRWVVGTVTDRVLRGGQASLLLVHPAHDNAATER
jgi:nucleotide-binding universal stress UspA family protein